MKELVVLSGKGGTGKTSITAAFASLGSNMVLCDADVDAANLHLVTSPTVRQTHHFFGNHEAVIDPDLCTGCGVCRQLCRFSAINNNYFVDAVDCEGCGVCVDLCPEHAIAFPQRPCGQWHVSGTRFGPMVHARLNIGGENSGKLVSRVREEARMIAGQNGLDFILTDGPPGIGCPVIASLGQASAVLIVAEPTVSGIHDMERVGQLCRHFNVPASVCINKYDLNPEKTGQIEMLARQHHMDVAGRVPFDTLFVQAMVAGKSVVEYCPASPVAQQLEQIWERVREMAAAKGEVMQRLA
jgi:MinD superfamily P-loop ATPase